MSHSAQARKHEEPLSFLSPEQSIAQGPWTLPQQRFLEVLQHRERQDTSITELCRLAGFPSRMPWYQALEDEHFAAVVQTFGIKMAREHRIPTREADGVMDAIRRQQERATPLPDHFAAHYLFRTDKGIITSGQMQEALKKLASHLTYEGRPYLMTAHQFRHSLATDMIEQGVDIYTVKEFLGHKTLAMTERYVKVYLSSLKAKYDAYRVKKQQTYASEMLATQIHVTQPEGDADGGWVENKVGKLYVSPLPDGIGNCVHLPMHDGCPDSPHCPTCPKLRATKHHLPVWEHKAQNLLITVEALRANPAYARARQKHEQELRHAEKVITTIKEEGFWDGRIHNGKAKDLVIAALRRRLDELKQTMATKDAELRQKQREIDRLYGKLAAGSPLTDAELRQQLQDALTRLALADDQPSA